MTQLVINISDSDVPLVKQLIEKIGGEVSLTNKSKAEVSSKTNNKNDSEKISPTYLFGKWKDTDIDPKTWRKKVWRRKS